MRLKISARSSHLARLQAYQVGQALQKVQPEIEIEYLFRESLGDKNLTDPLWKMPEKGVFTEDFYQDLVQEKTDLVVHSWKDLPTERNADTMICGTLVRADQRDLLLFKKSAVPQMAQKKTVQLFSSSQRRIYNLEKFLLKALPHQPEKILFKDIRGNIPTRLEKFLAATDVDGLILAKAALDRLLGMEEIAPKLRSVLQDLEFMVLPLSENPNAAAQGALAIEVKNTRQNLRDLVAKIQDTNTFDCVRKEREILSGYGGGCHQKIGIAVLRRDYGDVYFLKGLTDSGEVLDVQKIDLRSVPSKQGPKKMNIALVKNLFERKEIAVEIPKSFDAFFISRISAYRPVQGIVWTAGLETWKKLAAQNVWVHGSAESLGEGEDPRVEMLVGRKLKWAKLTHTNSDAGAMKSVPTYELTLKGDLPEEVLQADSLFWMSAYQFDVLTKKYPQLLSKNHACGLGQTYQALTARLSSSGRKPSLFLNESNWRQHE